MSNLSLPHVFSIDGPLAQAIPVFKARRAQLEMATEIDRAIHDRGLFIAEAGTGTGKTWAYLTPAFLSDAKVLVSTGTRTLQDQLFHRDIPRLRKALSLSINVALLKGRANYVCHYHLERAFGLDVQFNSPEEVEYLRKIEVFAQRSQTGDKSELSEVPEQASIWQRVSSTRENCLGQECPYIRDCFLMKARRKAQEADVVVVNHALIMADVALREEGISDLLPSVDVLVFDEAHQLPEVATRFLGYSLSSYQLQDLAKDGLKTVQSHVAEVCDWPALFKQYETTLKPMRKLLEPVANRSGGRLSFEAFEPADTLADNLQAIFASLQEIATRLQAVLEVHPDLEALHANMLEYTSRLFLWGQPDHQGNYAAHLHDNPPEPAVRWLECSAAGHWRLHRAPLSVARIFSRYRQNEQAWIFTSATLSVNGDFSHFTHQLGLHEAKTGSWESPFNYSEQGLLYVPQTLPLPANEQFNTAFVASLFPLLELSQGGVLILCTTLRAIRQIAELLEQRFEQSGLDRLLLRQGEASRGALLEQFRVHGQAVLVGSASFWEGVDIPGQALSLVAIDKLPFAPPDDPVLQARLNECRQRGGNPFMEYQLPQAAIALKQGAGRLIRSETDKGILLVGDTRLVEKPYGKLLWRGLPDFTRTRDERVAQEFMQACY